MDLAKLSPDVLMEKYSYMNPCQIASFLTTRDELRCVLESSDMLDKLSHDWYLPKRKTLKELCLLYNMNNYDLMIIAAKDGDIRVINHVMMSENYKHIVNYPIEKVENAAIQIASIFNHIDLVKWMLILNNNLLWSAVIGATKGNNINLVKMLLKNNNLPIRAADLNFFIKTMIKLNRIEMIKTLVENGTVGYLDVLENENILNDVLIFEMMIEMAKKYLNDPEVMDTYNRLLIYASTKNNIYHVYKLIESGATAISEAYEKIKDYPYCADIENLLLQNIKYSK